MFGFDAGSRGTAASSDFSGWEWSGSVLACNGTITVSQNTSIDHRNRDNVFSSSQRSIRPSFRPSHHPTHSSLWFFSDQTVMARHKQMVAVQKHEGQLQMDLRRGVGLFQDSHPPPPLFPLASFGQRGAGRRRVHPSSSALSWRLLSAALRYLIG